MDDEALLTAIREIIRDELRAALERRPPGRRKEPKEPDAAAAETLLRAIVDARLERRAN